MKTLFLLQRLPVLTRPYMKGGLESIYFRSCPMTMFDDREKAQEKKFAFDAETRFKIEARRNKLVGLWAAEKLGKTGEAAETYAREVVASDFEEAGDEDVLRKLAADLQGKASEAEIRAEMDRLLEIARQQIVK